MTSSHKIVVLIPPFLIGFTLLLTLFLIRHDQLLQEQAVAEDSSSFEVTKELPEPVELPVVPPDITPQVPREEAVACTMDAMECPDGSFVGRMPPSCEFMPCAGDVTFEETELEVI